MAGNKVPDAMEARITNLRKHSRQKLQARKNQQGGQNYIQSAKKVDVSFVDKLHRPGIEPGSRPWQGRILPLDQRCQRLLILLMFDVDREETWKYISQCISTSDNTIFSSPNLILCTPQ